MALVVVNNPPPSVGEVRDACLIPGLGRSCGGGHGNPLPYSCLENPYGQRSLVGYSPWGCKESDTTKRLHFSFFLEIYLIKDILHLGFPGSASSKEPACQCRKGSVLIPGLGRSCGGGHGNPLQYSCLENPPWTEEPGGLWSIGLQRVTHD